MAGNRDLDSGWPALDYLTRSWGGAVSRVYICLHAPYEQSKGAYHIHIIYQSIV